jgi:hypothetical protein
LECQFGYYCCSKACVNDKFVTSISDNGSTVVDKIGTCSKTQLKISDNEKKQYIYIYMLKKLKQLILAKEKTKTKTKTTTKWKQK